MLKHRLNISFTLGILVIMGLGLTSCTQHFYTTNAGNSLDLNEKNDLKFDYAHMLSNETSGKSMKAGYSPLKHWGVQTSYTDYKHFNEESGYMFTAATGYYYFLERNKQPDTTKWVTTHGHKTGILFDTYVGYGFGKTQYRYHFAKVNNWVRQYHIQEGVHFYFRRIFKFSILHRLSVLNYKKAKAIGAISEIGLTELNWISEHNPFIINELTAKLSLGLPKVNAFVMVTEGWANAKLGFSVNTSARLGLAFDINDFFKK